MRISRLVAVSAATGLLSGGIFGYPQFVDAGWSPEAALWLSIIGVVGPALVVAGLALASRAVADLLGLRRESSAVMMPKAPPQHPTPGRHRRAA